jgi:hypothetical protein
MRGDYGPDTWDQLYGIEPYITGLQRKGVLPAKLSGARPPINETIGAHLANSACVLFKCRTFFTSLIVRLLTVS